MQGKFMMLMQAHSWAANDAFCLCWSTLSLPCTELEPDTAASLRRCPWISRSVRLI